MPTDPGAIHTPAFLQNHIERHSDRVANQWDGTSITRPAVENPGSDSVWMQSNDYLALGSDRRIVEAEAQELLRAGHAVMMSAVFEEAESPTARLEKEFARHLHTEGAIFCQSGFAANCGLMEVLASLGRPVYIDFHAHRSLWYGVAAAGRKPVAFRHNSVSDLEQRVHRNGPGVIVIDTVYSSSGELAPLTEIADLALIHDCVLVVDESHSLGTHGVHGEGMVVEAGLEKLVHYRTASLAKALCGPGGIIAGNAQYLDMLRYEGSPQVFSSAPLPCFAIGFLETLKIVRSGRDLRERLNRNARFFRDGMRKAGFDIGLSECQIVSIYPGPELTTMRVKHFLEKRGVFGSVFAYPATPRKKSLLRFSVRQDHTIEELTRAIETCSLLHNEFETKTWRAHTIKRQETPA